MISIRSQLFHLLNAVVLLQSFVLTTGASFFASQPTSSCNLDNLEDCGNKPLPGYAVPLIIVGIILVWILMFCFVPIAWIVRSTDFCSCVHRCLRVHLADSVDEQYAKSAQTLVAEFQEDAKQQQPTIPLSGVVTLEGHQRTTFLPTCTGGRSDEMELTFQGDGTLTGKRNAADGATTVLKGQWCSGSFTWKEADPKNDKILLAMANGVYDKNARGVLSVVGDFRTASKSLGKLRYKST